MSMILTNSIKNSTHIDNIDDRQLFEYLYSMICSVANYGIFILDKHFDNFLSYNTEEGIIYEINNNKIYFNSSMSLCIIDYQVIENIIPIDNKYNISEHVRFIYNFCKNTSVKEKALNQLVNGTIDELLNSLINNFNSYIISMTNTEKNIPANTKIFTFKIL